VAAAAAGRTAAVAGRSAMVAGRSAVVAGRTAEAGGPVSGATRRVEGWGAAELRAEAQGLCVVLCRRKAEG
jgi:hypothetical protein